MITCQHARQLFDRYLDDELSASLETELHAHVIQCARCQNHLAVVEACGDVIRLDACEPRPSGSLADRVLAARRDRSAAVPAGRSAVRRRMVWRIGVPTAAAAGVVLALTLGTLMFVQGTGPKSVILSKLQAAPKEVQNNLLILTDRPLSSQEKEELARTPEMDALPYLDGLINPLVQGTQNAVAGTKQSYEDIGTLVRVLLQGAQDRLVAEYREKHPELSPQMVNKLISDLDILPAETSTQNGLTPESPAVEPSSPNAPTTPDAL